MPRQLLVVLRAQVTQWFEVTVAAVGLLVLTGGPSSLLTQRFTTGGPDFEIWTYQYPFGLVGLVGAVMLGRTARWPPHRWARAAVLLVAGFVGWSLASVWWSVIPSLTSSRALTSAGIASFAVWLGLGLGPSRQRLALGLATGAFVAISAVLVAVVPSYGRGVFRDNVTTNRFRGLAPNPNSLGPVCVLAIVTAVALALSSRDVRQRTMWGVVAGCAAVLLVGSRSDTALVGLGVGVAVAAGTVLVEIGRRRGLSGRVTGWAAVAVAVVVAAVCARWMWDLSDLLTGDATFGNRRSIWTRVWDVIEIRPRRGWGYWAYWNVTGSGAVVRYGSAHNSLLEVWLGLGVVGVAIFVAIVATAVAGTCRALWASAPAARWSVVVLGCLLVGHLTESFVLWHSYNWALICAFAVGAWQWTDRRQSPEAPIAAPIRSSASSSGTVNPSSPMLER